MDVNAFDLAAGAVVLPPVIALLNQWHWPAQLKGIVALLVCALYATGILILRDSLTWADWRDTLLQAAGAAFILYTTWWKPSGIAPAIEAGTSGGGRARTIEGTHRPG